MSHLTVMVVDPATRSAETECFDAISKRPDVQTASYHLPALEGMESLEQSRRADALIVLGSGASVYDELPWQTPLHNWVRMQMDAGVPTLGICYGHQMIAHIFDAPVELLWDGHKEKGQRTVRISSQRLGLGNISGPLTVSHREGVTRCPEGFRICAWSDDVRIDGIEHHTLPIWGVQPHVEAVHGFLSNNEIELTGHDDVFDFGYRFIDAFLRFAAKNKTD